MKAYFGVDSADASRSGLDEYNADAGVKDVGLNAVVSYLITPRWDVTGIAALPPPGRRRRRQPGNRGGLGEPVVWRAAVQLPFLRHGRGRRRRVHG